MTNYEWLLHMDGEERQAWFDAEHVDANDDLAPKSDVIAGDVDANDGNGSGQSNIEWLLSRSGVYRDADYCAFDNMVVKAAEECDLMPDGLKSFWRKHDWLLAPHESCAQDADQRERENVDGGESDSREKLEAEARRIALDFAANNAEEVAIEYRVIELLDRQAAITEREGREEWQKAASGEIYQVKQMANELAEERDLWSKRYQQSHELALELQDKVDELESFAHRLEACAEDDADVTLFGVDYVPAKKLEGLRALLAKLGEFDDDNDIDAPDYYERCWGGHVRTINEQRASIKRFKETLERVIGERDWFRSQFEKCLRATRSANVDDLMAYPLPEQYVEPYQIVTDAIDSQRDFSADVARLTAERDELAADLADAMKRLKIAQGEIKTQRNNFDQVQGSRDYWREKLSILLARLRDMGCKTGSINDLPIEIELPHGDGDEGMA